MPPNRTAEIIMNHGVLLAHSSGLTVNCYLFMKIHLWLYKITAACLYRKKVVSDSNYQIFYLILVWITAWRPGKMAHIYRRYLRCISWKKLPDILSDISVNYCMEAWENGSHLQKIFEMYILKVNTCVSCQFYWSLFPMIRSTIIQH